jgi:hypothetical protein
MVHVWLTFIVLKIHTLNFVKKELVCEFSLTEFTTPQKKVVKYPHKTYIFKIKRKESYLPTKLDITEFALYEGIPKNYFVEILATNFVYPYVDKNTGVESIIEFSIYPNELLMDVDDYEIKGKIQEDIEQLQGIGEEFATIGSLHQLKLFEIANDLTEALLRFERNDYEGSIKFFRKVIEGLKNYIKDKIVVDKNRTEKFTKFLGSSFGLISNFGEHAGTHGWLDEARLSKAIVIATCRYLISIFSSTL